MHHILFDLVSTGCHRLSRRIARDKTDYIDALVSYQKRTQHEIDFDCGPDSLPNCARPGVNGCTQRRGTFNKASYAISQFATLPHVTMYLDASHGGWLGWENNLKAFKSLLSPTVCAKLRGFATNVSNYQPLGSPCAFTGSDYNAFVQTVKDHAGQDECGYDPCDLSSQYNAGNNELNFVQLLAWAFKDVAFATPDKKPRFVIDTGRNGNDNARIGSEACKVWCNVNHVRVGRFPTTTTALPGVVDAYFWLKTPGESDGCIDVMEQGTCNNADGFGNQCVRYDKDCGTHPENIGYYSNQPCPPEAGGWFDYQMLLLAGQEEG